MENQPPQDTPNNEPQHICGVCDQPFASEADYLAHTCEKTGHNPTQAEHLILSTTPNFETIQQAALERGAEQSQPE